MIYYGIPHEINICTAHPQILLFRLTLFHYKVDEISLWENWFYFTLFCLKLQNVSVILSEDLTVFFVVVHFDIIIATTTWACCFIPFTLGLKII